MVLLPTPLPSRSSWVSVFFVVVCLLESTFTVVHLTRLYLRLCCCIISAFRSHEYSARFARAQLAGNNSFRCKMLRIAMVKNANIYMHVLHSLSFLLTTQFSLCWACHDQHIPRPFDLPTIYNNNIIKSEQCRTGQRLTTIHLSEIFKHG